MWNLKCTIIPVIIGATGIVTKSVKLKFGSCIRKTGTAVAQWLWGCVTNLKIAGSIPDGVTGIFK